MLMTGADDYSEEEEDDHPSFHSGVVELPPEDDHPSANASVEDWNQHDYMNSIENNHVMDTEDNLEFLVDSGSTSHVVNQDIEFIKIDETFQPGNHCVELADGLKTWGEAKERRCDVECTEFGWRCRWYYFTRCFIHAIISTVRLLCKDCRSSIQRSCCICQGLFCDLRSRWKVTPNA